MNETFLPSLLSLLIGFVIGYWIWRTKLHNEEQNRKRLAGKLAEKFIPFMKDFPYSAEDSTFFGMPIDYLVFDGLNAGDVKDIVFIEVKSGGSQLSTRQQMIKDAVIKKRIRWEEVRI